MNASSSSQVPFTPHTHTFPSSLTNLVELATLQGSSHPKKVQDPSTQQLYVLKKSFIDNNKEHLVNEYNTNQAYSALGVNVPPMRLYEDKLLIHFIDAAVDLKQYKLTASKQQIENVYNQLKKHFVVDCLFANWDVIGSHEDNVCSNI
jgi:hypothetical protein